MLYTPARRAQPLALATNLRPFHSTRVIRDWHQRLDPQTGEYFYYNIFTKERRSTPPEEGYLPYNAPRESKLLRFLRTDTTSERTGEMPGLKYWLTFAGVGGLFLLWDYYNPPGQSAKEVQRRFMASEEKTKLELDEARARALKDRLRRESEAGAGKTA